MNSTWPPGSNEPHNCHIWWQIGSTIVNLVPIFFPCRVSHFGLKMWIIYLFIPELTRTIHLCDPKPRMNLGSLKNNSNKTWMKLGRLSFWTPSIGWLRDFGSVQISFPIFCLLSYLALNNVQNQKVFPYDSSVLGTMPCCVYRDWISIEYQCQLLMGATYLLFCCQLCPAL